VSLWLLIALMCLVAAMFVVLPLRRAQKPGYVVIMGSVGLMLLVAFGLYALRGSPDIPSAASKAPDVDAMVASLAARLESDPDDLNGWKMLGRSYMTLENFAAAVNAYEKAVALEQPQNAQTLVDLGGALLARDNTRIEGRASALFESALALEPNNPSALFYGGIGALNRGDAALAADRWEILLGLNPPEEFRAIIEQRIAEWRGLPPPLAAQGAAVVDEPGAIVTAEVSVPAATRERLPAEASVFVIARDPEQPSPPIAVARRLLSELPASVTLSDSDSMIPGRRLSAFAEVEIVVRISVSGQPVAQSGDWFASQIVKPAENNTVSLQINRQIP